MSGAEKENQLLDALIEATEIRARREGRELERSAIVADLRKRATHARDMAQSGSGLPYFEMEAAYIVAADAYERGVHEKK